MALVKSVGKVVNFTVTGRLFGRSGCRRVASTRLIQPVAVGQKDGVITSARWWVWLHQVFVEEYGKRMKDL